MIKKGNQIMKYLIRKEKFGTNQRTVVRVQNAERPDYQVFESLPESVYELFAQMEYWQKHKIKFEIAGFRTDKELYPDD